MKQYAGLVLRGVFREGLELVWMGYTDKDSWPSRETPPSISMLIYPMKINLAARVARPNDSTNRIDDVRRD